MKKNLSILGSTGSIGKQTLEIAAAYPSSFNVVAIAAKDEVDLIVEQIKKFNPLLVSVENEKVKAKVEEKLAGHKVELVFGEEGLKKAATLPQAQTVVVAIPGTISLIPAMEAIAAKKDIALASKEVLVTAGGEFMEEAGKNKVKIFPIDSEHSAIAQCLAGEDHKKIKKIILTASGGPFLKTPIEKLAKMTAKEALAHPTWNMGPKITIDSATLMNKGLEVIEAHYLFDLDYSKIDVIVHPQSIIHSMVEFVDGSIKAQLGAPDMRVPIQYALFGMGRLPNMWKKLDFTKLAALTFEKPDKEKFSCLDLAYQAGRTGGTMPAVMNAANDEAVNQFLRGKIGYLDIAILVREAMASNSLLCPKS
ncbi:1-deoxy-D-xylulose-5-phosphate reductoisomerase [candidate division WOR-1 bacterium RIFOXYA12_FULL_43_27]|uniref:1-deoxy-D-xylulose 5-phosphate reductoisomerase n=1 Tax=candidate division WOR-1 bacterium RIFOXYC2_FULL_46_14 TaxID=1802587 RepID=A0A1F4U4V9_UNCSA|nr:MAG: 1-deoxy-D-xylulose-5-phosphate reductoisomerase [candidate division WOR-1 bacterium RIFOXYA12_FULL_43_27]OGC20697.1 MAG: 1-deoxy-D-xylulose-5-phosphate reductoisomerase [candidate division WOR-1 bacterium RIFOXYB2_FULL_46_45]OGC31566.1 MAG: 1-deoxy-D-xylulose-5-phosphate reductoisomerase [candidate division WOR-1 bacterium RIFOXYA2_FULL_46_56]OGC39972.1 MAG: 1-deoxy-D-xylulose-5-phosphate reductoisomerase [candidate division WOR-1 bacterium RIFOXYC2_FULL_46_14]